MQASYNQCERYKQLSSIFTAMKKAINKLKAQKASLSQLVLPC